MTSKLKGIIDRIEGDLAVVVLKDGQKINWPLDRLGLEPREGQAVCVWLKEDLEKTLDKETQAKNFLNEILQNE